ncbi:SDR family NAD(P)-dependent oxidoreductase [Streptomyces sp. NPDC050560]|uniref:SDR family NAD(P)-dependent oxidoreductase n=1 Tax=Streptomyces sp. NPDC050560 TaxID=3365630 RepID=UPI0037A205C3
MTTGTSLKGRVALVTGAGRNIGAVIAAELARREAAVAINYRKSVEGAEQGVRDIRERGGRAGAYQADVRDMDGVRGMVDAVEDDLGPVDTLVLNATGFDDVLRGPALGHTVDELQEEMAAQFRAALVPAYVLAPRMAERGGGNIVFISAIYPRRTMAGGLGHALAKVSVETAMKHLAVELGPQGVRVNTVIPDVTRSEGFERAIKLEHVAKQLDSYIGGIPLRRIAEPEEVARAVASIVSDDMSYVTGAFLPVAGGNLIL